MYQLSIGVNVINLPQHPPKFTGLLPAVESVVVAVVTVPPFVGSPRQIKTSEVMFSLKVIS